MMVLPVLMTVLLCCDQLEDECLSEVCWCCLCVLVFRIVHVGTSCAECVCVECACVQVRLVFCAFCRYRLRLWFVVRVRALCVACSAFRVFGWFVLAFRIFRVA